MSHDLNESAMTLYIGTKTIRAMPMLRGDYNDYRGWDVPEDEDPADEGYLVEYVDDGPSNHPAHAGYISWSPLAVFEKSYREVAGGMNFGHALEILKGGGRVQRAGWNGKGMWLSLTMPSPETFMVSGFGIMPQPVATEHLTCLPWIGMRTADAKYVPWLASQTDMLAEDWGLFAPS